MSRYSSRKYMSFNERILSPEYESAIFSNWASLGGVLASPVKIILTILISVFLSRILAALELDPHNVQNFMLISFTWALIGVYARKRTSEKYPNRESKKIRVVLCILASFIALYGYIFMGDFRNIEPLAGSFAVGSWAFFTITFLAVGSFTAPFRLLWRIGLFIKNKINNR
jgi:hypothetical protein